MMCSVLAGGVVLLYQEIWSARSLIYVSSKSSQPEVDDVVGIGEAIKLQGRKEFPKRTYRNRIEQGPSGLG